MKRSFRSSSLIFGIFLTMMLAWTMFFSEPPDILGNGSETQNVKGSQTRNARLVVDSLQHDNDAQVSKDIPETTAMVIEEEVWRGVALQSRHPATAELEVIPTLNIQRLNGISRVIYNRVPKCGSRGAIAVFKRLAKANGFHFMHSHIYNERSLSEHRQKEFVKTIVSSKPPLLFDRHIHFVNFARYRGEEPVYINIIRDPVDRLVSEYYYRRFDKVNPAKMSQRTRNQTYDDCVEKGREECTLPWRKLMIIPFFCGQDAFCLYPSQVALTQAQRNVEQHFPVVGIMEDLPGFFRLLEWTIPTFFNGAASLFQGRQDQQAEKFQNPWKQLVKNSTKTFMEKKLNVEYAFYKWIRQRFYAQLLSIERQKG